MLTTSGLASFVKDSPSTLVKKLFPKLRAAHSSALLKKMESIGKNGKARKYLFEDESGLEKGDNSMLPEIGSKKYSPSKSSKSNYLLLLTYKFRYY